MGLRGEDALRFGFTDTPRKSAMSGSNMRGNVREHVFTTLNIFVEKIGGELRIQNARGTGGKKYQQQNGNDGNEETSDD